jgi:hypothetical protein
VLGVSCEDCLPRRRRKRVKERKSATQAKVMRNGSSARPILLMRRWNDPRAAAYARFRSQPTAQNQKEFPEMVSCSQRRCASMSRCARTIGGERLWRGAVCLALTSRPSERLRSSRSRSPCAFLGLRRRSALGPLVIFAHNGDDSIRANGEWP